MTLITGVEVCDDCRHPLEEHDNVIGCRHALTVETGETFDCVCSAARA